MTDGEATSIFSHEERAVATALTAGTDPVTIAETRDSSVEQVEAAVERIREKTERAFATLEQSPFTTDLARDLEPTRRAELRAALENE
jgi:beta-glucosidase-like glycosyl hydrolase